MNDDFKVQQLRTFRKYHAGLLVDTVFVATIIRAVLKSLRINTKGNIESWRNDKRCADTSETQGQMAAERQTA